MSDDVKLGKTAAAGPSADLARPVYKHPALMAVGSRVLDAWDWFIDLPRWMVASVISLIVIGAMSFVFFLGFVSGERAVGPTYPFFAKVTNKLDQMFFAGGPVPKLEGATYNSALIRLVSEVGEVDFGRPDGQRNFLAYNGGGLTSFGDDVLLLAYDGNIYAASGPRDIRRTAIDVPDNNREAYIALADDPTFSDYQFHRGYLRYNDLIHVETPGGSALIASYTEYHAGAPGEACYTNTLARLDLPADATDVDQLNAAASDWSILFRTDPCMPFKQEHLAMEGHMAAGRLTFSAPLTLYMTSGDFHLDGMRSNGPGIAQDMDAMYGKTLAVDIETGEGRIVSAGHRNAQGIAISPAGHVMVFEHGPRGGDEINIIREGANYGWPLESYGTTYGGTPIPNSISYGRHTQFEPPAFSFVPSVASSGLTVIDGFHESWDGDMLASSLTDQSIYRIRMEGDEVVYSERIEIGSRIRYVHQHNDGRIVLWTDNGELIFLTALERVDEEEKFRNWLAEAELPGRIKTSLNTLMQRCTECHSFQVGDHERSPGLNKIYGDDIAATTFAGYSDGLSSRSGHWSRENLIAYLQDPQGFAPGSIMPAADVEDEQVLEALVDYLETLDRQF